MRRQITAALFAATLSACAPSAPAGETLKDAPFDFLVLSLSWSPSYCATEGEDANRQQCDTRARHAFVVHGLWPQLESGWPEFCDSEEPRRVPDALVREMLDIMPSAGLIGHQWRKHGTCTGLSQRDYFALVRDAYDRIAIPQRFEEQRRQEKISPAEVENAFVDANTALSGDGIAVLCNDGHISEVRICLANDLSFRSCPQVDARGCRMRQAAMPAPGR